MPKSQNDDDRPRGTFLGTALAAVVLAALAATGSVIAQHAVDAHRTAPATSVRVSAQA